MPDLKNKTIGVLGLSFKPDTGDIREAPSIKIIKELIMQNAKLKAYDPKAMDNFKKIFPGIAYTNAEDVLNSDAVLILTEWDEFKKLDYSGKMVIDGRRIDKAKKQARTYEGVCWQI